MNDLMPIMDQQPRLFDPSEYSPEKNISTEPFIRQMDHPVWTDNKAHFIMLYLKYFVYITKHGTYIDGFAGPQEGRSCDSWAAKLVIESEPKWMRHFHLCDQNRTQFRLLKQLKESQPPCAIARNVEIYHGDFNSKVDEILASGDITEKEATFCLLDQRTFECHWQTVEKIAAFKTAGNKIELFYFLANNWLERAFHAQKDLEVLTAWWGRDDWTNLRSMSRDVRRDLLIDRFKRDLGYRSVKSWPIYERKKGGAIMFYMIHATDHPEAPNLMSRAYCNTVSSFEPIEQLELGLFPVAKSAEIAVEIAEPKLKRFS